MERLRRLLNIQPGEGLPLLVFTFLLAVNSAALEISYIVATSGFMKQLRVEQFPLLWVLDMALILLVSSLFGLVVDRLPRLRLVGGILLLFAAISLAYRFLLATDAPAWLTFPGIYLLAEQQYVVFPLAFWALANDRFAVAQAKRLFPLLAAGGLLGQVAGASTAAFWSRIFALSGVANYELLLVNAAIFALAFLFLLLAGRYLATGRVRQSAGHHPLRETVTTGLDFVRNIPALRYLAGVMLGTGFVLVVVEYYFLVTADVAFATAGDFQTFYGLYRVALTLVVLAVEVIFTGRFLRRYGLKDAFLLGPGAMVAAVGSMLLWPGLIGGAAGRFIARLAQSAVNDPANKTLFGLIPEERRGRVSTFMTSYLYVIGNMAGSLLLLLLIASGFLAAALPGRLFYLLPTLGLALLLIFWAWRSHQVYDQSLLNWRFARRRRRTSHKLDDMLDSLK